MTCVYDNTIKYQNMLHIVCHESGQAHIQILAELHTCACNMLIITKRKEATSYWCYHCNSHFWYNYGYNEVAFVEKGQMDNFYLVVYNIHVYVYTVNINKITQ